MPSDNKYEFARVDPHDFDAVREWAKLRCKRWTLERLASFVGAHPTLEAVSAYLSRGLPEDAARS
jgi:hypothetical protein